MKIRLRPKYKTYNPRVILSTITTFNPGYTLAKTNKITNRRFGLKLPESTIYSWIRSYADVCTFIKLRKEFELNSDDLIRTKRLRHMQVYDFSYHTLKLNLLSKGFPELKKSLNHSL